MDGCKTLVMGNTAMMTGFDDPEAEAYTPPLLTSTSAVSNTQNVP